VARIACVAATASAAASLLCRLRGASPPEIFCALRAWWRTSLALFALRGCNDSAPQTC